VAGSALLTCTAAATIGAASEAKKFGGVPPFVLYAHAFIQQTIFSMARA
jgi:hypothetical protein